MMAAHTWPRSPDPGELLVDGRPSVLFAVVAGVALGLITGGDAPPAADRGRLRARLALRAGLLLVAGVLLWMLPSGIAIILDAYGLLFLALLPLLFASRTVLAAVAGALLVTAPLVRDRVVEVTGVGPSGPVMAPDAGALATDWLLTGYYPVLLWLPLLLAGLWCARAGLQRRRTRLLMIGLGAAASLAGYGAAAALPGIDASAHSGSTAELLGAGGLAIAIVGGLLLLLDGERTPRAVALAGAPLAALGRVALTVYVGHVVVIALLEPLGPAGLFAAEVGIPLLIALAVAGVALGLVCDRLGRRGPLEAALSAAVDGIVPRRAPGARLGA
jgi:hypothetical protein